MSDRRSGRSKKSINYSKFAADFSDDDFADTTPPPPKKSKPEEKVKKSQTSQGNDKEPTLNLESTLRSKKARKPVTERHFDRQLEEALQLSILETGGSQSENHPDVRGPPLLTPNTNTAYSIHNLQSNMSPPSLQHPASNMCSTQVDSHVKLEARNDITEGTKQYSEPNRQNEVVNLVEKKIPVIKLKRNTSFSAVLDESIEVLEDEEETKQFSTGRTSKRNCITKKKVVIESDEEDEEASGFVPDKNEESEEDSEDTEKGDESESDDSDFAQRSKKTFTKKKNDISTKNTIATKKNPISSISKLSNITNTKVKQKPNVKEYLPSISSTTSKRNSPFTPEFKLKDVDTATNNRTPPIPIHRSVSSPPPPVSSSSPATLTAKWKPPSFASECPSGFSGVSVNSPSSGIRLGLSRNQRTKPLHSSLKVT